MATLSRRALLAGVPSAAAVAALGTGSSRRARASGGDWHSFARDAANTGLTTDPGPSEEVGPEWEVETGGAVESSPTVADGLVFVGSDDGHCYAVAAGSGEEEWTFDAESRIRSAPAYVTADAVEGVENDGRTPLVVFGSESGRIFAVDAVEGSLEWHFDTDGEVSASPTVAGGTVYIGSEDGHCYALDASEGTEQWAFETESWVDSTPAVADGVVYVGSRDNHLYAIDAEDGIERWAFETADFVNSSPAVATGERATVYVGSLDGRLYAVDAESGEGQWAYDTGNAITSSPALAPPGTHDEETNAGRVYVCDRGGVVHALDVAGGEDIWTFAANAPVTASPAVTPDQVVVGAEDNTVYGLDPESGVDRWAYPTEGRVQSSPAVVGADCYVGSNAGALYRLADGGLTERVEPPPPGPAQEDGGLLEGVSFLLLPAAIVGWIAVVLGLLYAGYRTGVLDRLTPDPPQYDPEAEKPGIDDLVLADVIRRADETTRTATQDLLVTKYVDAGTLDAPLVAYEVESYRDEPTRVRLSEPAPTLAAGDLGTLPGRDMEWALEGGRLTFETTVDPDERVRTVLARQDRDAGDVEGLVERPTVEILDLGEG